MIYCIVFKALTTNRGLLWKLDDSKHFKMYKKIRANLMGREDLLKIEWSGECIKQKQKYINGNQYHG